MKYRVEAITISFVIKLTTSCSVYGFGIVALESKDKEDLEKWYDDFSLHKMIKEAA